MRMPNKSYQKGYRFEREIKQYLEQKGYLVFRMAGSHSLADLIVFDHTKWKAVYLIQCKCGSAKMNKEAIVRLTRLADKCNAMPVYCSKRPGQSVSFMNMNTTTEIEFVEPR